MNRENTKSLLYTSLAIIIGCALVRCLIGTQFLLAPDEANYWQWSRYPALGYHDHPPMIAWSIWLSTRALGHSELAVRLPAILGGMLFSLYTVLLTAHWTGWKNGPAGALLTQVILLYTGSALLATPDSLLLPCWAAACYHASLALSGGRYRTHWILTGTWFGLGMLSKYTMLLFLPCLFFCMLSRKKFRHALTGPWPWLGLVMSSLLFSPVILWNLHNEWTTFRHVLYQGGIDHGWHFSIRYLGNFFGAQATLLSPFLLLFILFLWLYPPATRDLDKDARTFLIWMSLPGFVLFFLLAFHVRIYGNWPAPIFTTGLVLFLAVFSPEREKQGSKWPWRLSLYGAICTTLPVLIQVTYPLLPLPLDLDRTAKETTGWDQLGVMVYEKQRTMKRPELTFLFGLRYQYASELAFYTPGHPRTVSINRWTRPNVYDFWVNDAMLQGQDGIGVFQYRPMADLVATLFHYTDPIEEITLTRYSPWFGTQPVQKLYLITGYGFKGGQRWLPRDNRDIRSTKKSTESK